MPLYKLTLSEAKGLLKEVMDKLEMFSTDSDRQSAQHDVDMLDAVSTLQLLGWALELWELKKSLYSPLAMPDLPQPDVNAN